MYSYEQLFDVEDLTQWITRQLATAYRLEMMMNVHILLWGVPVGPTLSMVVPTRPQGICSGCGDECTVYCGYCQGDDY